MLKNLSLLFVMGSLLFPSSSFAMSPDEAREKKSFSRAPKKLGARSLANKRKTIHAKRMDERARFAETRKRRALQRQQQRKLQALKNRKKYSKTSTIKKPITPRKVARRNAIKNTSLDKNKRNKNINKTGSISDIHVASSTTTYKGGLKVVSRSVKGHQENDVSLNGRKIAVKGHDIRVRCDPQGDFYLKSEQECIVINGKTLSKRPMTKQEQIRFKQWDAEFDKEMQQYFQKMKKDNK